MTMEAFAQSLHTMYSIPTTQEMPAETVTESNLCDNSTQMVSQSRDNYYGGRYPTHTDHEARVMMTIYNMTLILVILLLNT